MADQTTPIPQVSQSVSQRETQINNNFDAGSPSLMFGRRASACAGLVFGYIGGRFNGTDVANGTVTATDDATNYVVVDRSTLAVSVSTSSTNWNNTTSYGRMYKLTAADGAIIDYEDHRGSNDGTGIHSQAATSSITVNAQTGTSYSVQSSDRAKLVTCTNGSPIAVTLPQAGSSFPSGWFCHVQNRGAGLVTITPTTSTIDGAASLTLRQDEGALIVSNGTNYFTQRGRARQLASIVVAVSYAATTTVDLAPYARWDTVILDLTLTGDVEFNLTNGTDGQTVKLRCRQDGSGNHIWTSGANLRFSADITSIVLSTAASKLDYIGFEWNGTDGKADVLAINKGF